MNNVISIPSNKQGKYNLLACLTYLRRNEWKVLDEDVEKFSSRLKSLTAELSPKYKGQHIATPCREEGDLVWRCNECSTKIRLNLKTGIPEYERQGEFEYQHIFIRYQPTEQEFEEAGMSPVDFSSNLVFGMG